MPPQAVVACSRDKENPSSHLELDLPTLFLITLTFCKMATFPLPPTDLNSREAIRFLHPGYSISNKLLSLPRVDRVESTTTFGVHYGTALLACQIIAGNAFDTGRLTLDQAGQQPVNLLLNDILTENVYYFMIGEGLGMYLITYNELSLKCVPF
jgi:hypothetical protein